jgi:RNA polymerase sigma-70 factor, ECF subfamily
MAGGGTALSDELSRRRGAEARQASQAIDDAGLVERARAGDRWAEDALVRRHGREVARLIARLLGSHDEVHDLAQDTFLAAFEQLDGLREPAVFRGWLLRIAVNKARRQLRRKQLMRRFGLDQSTPDATLEAIAAEGVGPEVRLELMELDRALSALPADLRIAWMLRYVEGHTVRDVSRLCSCSLTTIKRRLRAAQEKVLAAIDEEVIRGGW